MQDAVRFNKQPHRGIKSDSETPARKAQDRTRLLILLTACTYGTDALISVIGISLSRLTGTFCGPRWTREERVVRHLINRRTGVEIKTLKRDYGAVKFGPSAPVAANILSIERAQNSRCIWQAAIIQILRIAEIQFGHCGLSSHSCVTISLPRAAERAGGEGGGGRFKNSSTMRSLDAARNGASDEKMLQISRRAQRVLYRHITPVQTAARVSRSGWAS